MLAPDAHRVLVAHLGGGGSLCAVRDGRSAMTTMGFTPLDGLVMGTRCGTIDPGALLWIRRHHPDDDLERALDEESGLLGLCGTADLREVHARVDAGDGDAVLAFGVWRHRLLTLAGACITALGGVDAIAFTGGIGEHDHRARTTLCDGLAWAGIRLDDERSRAADGDGEITGPTSTARLFVIRSREDLMLAEGAASVLAG